MKTILITSFHPFVSRNIFATRFFEMLKGINGIKIVIVCPEKKKDFLKKEYGAENVIVRGVPGRIRRIDAFFKDLAMAAVRTRSIYIMKKMRIGFERPWFINLVSPLAFLLKPTIPFLYRIFTAKNSYADIFEEYKPDVVFATDIFSSADCKIANEAKMRGVKVLGMVRSWDNLTTKGGFRIIPDVLAVNNEIVKNEAIKIHGIPEEIIKVVGVPHYDRYLCPAENSLRKKFELHGKKIILYSPLGDRIIKVGDGEIGKGFDDKIIKILSGIIPETHILFVRMPPTDTVFIEEDIPENVVIERPGTILGTGVKAIKTAELSASDDSRLIETICASDVVLTVFSSIAVDALVLGKPVILIGFDPVNVDYWKSVARLHELDHMCPLINGGITIAKNKNSLSLEIQKYIKNSDADKNTRAKMCKEQAYSLDGKSSERLLKIVEDMAL
jgi:hypothetical protein